ncbi:Uncharacterized HTH-type transcriptional regulator ypdC [[Eubacterium] contortum]|uniref:Uncharacterized HTH-type transcriptional regulator ypdC n=1 Tax=Faecalicatena contorta TaxID=39482 RepID=A0A174GTW4_9FIRM|nr:AraC family transcriptional regulator [Faecalicatena contorta]CUO66142.1 Uncharacterized HTH-type transcriptional regulator ypdC [[Eubacterium] contortum] [Faecalicatena contorta]
MPTISSSDKLSCTDYTPLKVTKLGSIPHAFFQLSAPYALVAEYVKNSRSYMDYICTAPNYYKHEVIRSNKDVDPSLVTDLHQHDAVEIMFVLEGYVEHRIEDQRYFCNAGQCCILNKWIRHIESYSSDYKAIFLLLSDDFITMLSRFNHLFNSPKSINLQSSSILEKLLTLIQNSSYKKCYIDFRPRCYNTEVQAVFQEIFDHIMSYCKHTNVSSTFFSAGYIMQFFTLLGNTTFFNGKNIFLDAESGEYLFRQIVHILETYHGNVSRADMESILHYSGNYINKTINKFTGKSLCEYKNEFAMKYARDLLIKEQLSINEIMRKIGFSNKTYFYKCFKKVFHMTPKEYQNNHFLK